MLVIFLIGLFILLGVTEWRTSLQDRSLVDSWISHSFWIVGAFLLFLLVLACTYIYAISPLRLERFYGYYQRFQPIFIWIGLALLLFFCLAFLVRGPRYWFNVWKELLSHPRSQKLWQWLNSAQAGISLLVISLLIGLTKLYFGLFVDETDNLYVGWLISKGYVLYRDVFSHHFPFPYYWTALVAAFFGNSFPIMRLSVLLLQIGLFAIAIKVTQFYLVIGLTSLIWNLINQFHRGQEVLYQTLEGIFLVVSFIIIFGWLVKKSKPGYITLALVGLLLGLALATDPLAIYPVSVAILGVFVAGIVYQSQSRWREGFRRLLVVGAAAALIPCIFLVNLIVSGTLKDFYRSTFWFNAQVYSKYPEYTNPFQFDNVIHNVASGLDILNPKWVENTSPFFPLESLQSSRLDNEEAYFTWIFSTLLFRLSILVCCLGLILSRKYLAAIFLLLFSATLLLRLPTYFYTIGFTLLSLFAACFLLIQLRSPALISAASSGEVNRNERNKGPGLSKRAILVAWSILLILIAGMWLWVSFRGAYFIANQTSIEQDRESLLVWKRIGNHIRDLACGQQVEIAVFEGNPMIYFASGLLPATKYTFMNPWVAEVGQQEIITTLNQKPSAVVWVNRQKGNESLYPPADYLKDLISFLDNSYIYQGNDYWESPDLAAHCLAK